MSEETLGVNSSSDLLNDFLGQQNSEEDVQKTDIINDGGEDKEVDKIEPLSPELIPNKDLEISSQIPEGFEEEAEDDDSDDFDNKDKDVDSGQYNFKALASYLSEEGLIDFEDSDELENNEEVLRLSVKKTIDNEIKAYKDSIPDKAKQLIEYIEKGGDVDTYLTKLQKPFDIKSIDLESEVDQEKLVRENLKLQGYEQAEIDETINDYKDSLLLDKQAKVASRQLSKHFEKIEESIILEQEAEQEAQKENYKIYLSNINSTIDSSDVLAGLPITNKEKLDFKKYLLSTDKDGLTQYAKEVNENPVQTQLELAYLKYMKYDFSKAMKKGETAATKKIKDIFKSNETNIKTGKSIEEANNDKDNLSAFSVFANRRK